ncbi:tudor domain-containing 6 [Betta splendens]|uniref:Tudor domain-containing 6 n=1 Tax=Betta splendens TaxID=158456 RepID=A0A9W2XL68_BETSP|nr:tudor domain-containing 6 [Betta splendens]
MSSIAGLPVQGSDVTFFITKVHLHHLCKFVEFWGKFSQERTAEYERLAEDIQIPGCIFKEFEGNSYDQCLAQVNGTWYRSRIVSRNGSKYSVYLFDKGTTVTTTSNMLAWGKKEHFHLPPEVEFCVLANVLPLSPEYKWSPVALAFLKSLSGKSVKAHVQDVLVTHRLFVLHIPCISTTMYEMGFAKKLFPDRFRDFVFKSLEVQSETSTEDQSQLLSIRTVEQLQKQDLFMYPELPVETVETVIVTEVINPQQIFCQLKVFSQELTKISERLKQSCEGRKTSCIVGPEMTGSPCAARGNDGRWYRSILQEVFPSSKTVEVLNVDYGTKHTIQVENVRPLAAEFFRMPVVTYTCSLHGVTDNGMGWTSSQIEFLRNLLLCKTVIAKFEYQSLPDSIHYVTLFGDENVNINNLFGLKVSSLLKTHDEYAIDSPAYGRQLSAHQEQNQEKNVTPRNAAKEVAEILKMLPAEELHQNSSHLAVVQHVSSPSEFWIQKHNCTNELNELMDNIYDFYKEPGKDVVRNPSVGLYCAARAENGDFYRAVVSEVGERCIKVFFVDYGSTESVDRINIRILPDRFKRLPRLALKCSLAGVRPKDERWSQSACGAFINVVIGKILHVHVVAELDDCYVVHLTDPEAQGEKDLGTLMCSLAFAQSNKIQGQPKTKISMQPAILPLAQPPGAKNSHRNSGKSVQTQNTEGLDNNERIRLKFKEHIFPIGSVLDVGVSCIESPNDFWCQLVQNAGHLKLLMHDIQAHYSGSEFQPVLEPACVARHPDNGMWYRAFIIHKHETPHVDVLFVDYGQTETVSLYDLRKICPKFLTLQGQAFRCRLLNIADPTCVVNDWNDEAIARFNNFVKTAACNFVILKCTIFAIMCNEQKILFNIVDLETPFESICASLVNLVKSASSQKTSKPSFHLDTYYYSRHNIKTGTEEQVSVTCVNSVGQFYCQLERNTNLLKDLNSKVRNLCCRLNNALPLPGYGTLCFAKYTDGQWYRGQIKATKPAILVHFVDYGNTVEVDKSDLLPVTSEANEIVSVPVQAIVCSLSDVPASIPSEANTWFEKSATDCKFRALIVAREPDGKLLVELYHRHTQINSKIKKMFHIEMDREQAVCHGGKVQEPANNELIPKAAPKQANEMKDHTQTVSRVSALKPAHKMREDPKPAEVGLQSASKSSRRKAEAASQELYRPPHQRQLCEHVQSVMGNGFEPADAQVEPNTNLSTDIKQLHKSTSPGMGFQKEKCPKVEDLPLNSVTSGMEADVYVSHCNNPLSFFVQLVRDEDEIFSVVEKLNDPKSFLKTNVVKDLNPGDLVQAEFEEDSSWYRAVVREVHADAMALVEFLDFGNASMTPISKIAALDKYFLQFPVYSTHCMLSSAVDYHTDKVCSPEVVSVFKEAVGGNGEKVLRCLFIRPSGSLWEVSLGDNGVNVTCEVSTGTNSSEVSSVIVEHVEENPEENLHTHPDSPHYEQQELLEGQQLEIYVAAINDAQTIWCQSAETKDLDEITSRVSEVVADHNSLNPGSLSPGSPCIALFSGDKFWYRAEVIDKDGDDLHVLFVDYGNVAQVNIADLREIPRDLLKVPPQAFVCELEGFDSSCGSWDSCAVEELSTVTADKLLQLTITRVERNGKNLKCFGLIESDHQSINEIMKVWWRSPTTDEKPGEIKSTPLYEPSLKCDSAEVQVNDKEQSSEPNEPPKTNEVKLTSRLKTNDLLNLDPFKSKEALLPHGGTEETVPTPFNEKDDHWVFTNCDKNVCESEKDSEQLGTSVMDCTGPDDFPFSLDEELKEATDISVVKTTKLAEVDAENPRSCIDDVPFSVPKQDDGEMVSRETFVTNVGAVKMVCRRKSPDLNKETKMSSKDVEEVLSKTLESPSQPDFEELSLQDDMKTNKILNPHEWSRTEPWSVFKKVDCLVVESNSREEAPAPALEEEEAPAPALDEEEAPAPALDEEEAPAPALDEEEAPAPALDEEEAPAPALNEEEAPAPALALPPALALEEKEVPAPALALPPAPALEEKEVPAPALEEKEVPAPALDEEGTPALALDEEGTPVLAHDEEEALALPTTLALDEEEAPALTLEGNEAPALEGNNAPALASSPAPALEEKGTPALALDQEEALALDQEEALALDQEEVPALPPPLALEEEGAPALPPARALDEEEAPARALDEEEAPARALDEEEAPARALDEEEAPARALDEEEAPARALDEEEAPARAIDEEEAPAPALALPPAPVLEEKEVPAPALALPPAPALEEKEVPAPALALPPAPALEEKEVPAPALEEKEVPALALDEEGTPALALDEEGTPVLAHDEEEALALPTTLALDEEEAPALTLDGNEAPALEGNNAPALASSPAPALEEKGTPALALDQEEALALDQEEAPALPPPLALEEEGAPALPPARALDQEGAPARALDQERAPARALDQEGAPARALDQEGAPAPALDQEGAPALPPPPALDEEAAPAPGLKEEGAPALSPPPGYEKKGALAPGEEKLFALSSDMEYETYTNNGSDMSTLALLVKKISLTDCKDQQEAAQTNE